MRMQSDVYKQSDKWIVINKGTDDEKRILTWGMLLLYIDIIRLYKYGINENNCLSRDNNVIFNWMKPTGNSCNTQSPYSRLFGSRNAVPSHGIAFYVDGVGFDDFITAKVGLKKTNDLFCIISSIYKRFPGKDYYYSTYPVLIYSMKDFVTLFNYLINTPALSNNTNNIAIISKVIKTIDDEYLNKRVNI